MQTTTLTPVGEVSVLDKETSVGALTVQPNSFGQLTMEGISEQGREEEKALNEVLNRFLERIGRNEDPQLFKLIAKLKEEIDKENLPDVADRILNAKPGFLDKLLGMLNKKSLSRAQERAFDAARMLASGKTKSLRTVVEQLEQELTAEQSRLGVELQVFEQLKREYTSAECAYESLVKNLQGYLGEVKKLPVPVSDGTPGSLAAHNDHLDKLQALESRVLALEGTYTRLPADQETIRQLQQAGFMTLQETSTTAAARFASIKMTLLTLHGALVTQGVHRLSEQGAALDANLMAVRSKLAEKVVSTAANAPGNNRIAQAEQIKEILANTNTLIAIADDARKQNLVKFDQARKSLAESRLALLNQSKNRA